MGGAELRLSRTTVSGPSTVVESGSGNTVGRVVLGFRRFRPVSEEVMERGRLGPAIEQGSGS